MTKHSKNNTASSVFTKAERDRLTYGTQRERLGSDSKRAFDACFLCLTTAIEPMSCPDGHIGCKECFYENILAQKKNIKQTLHLIELSNRQKLTNEKEAIQLETARELSKVEAAVSVTGTSTTLPNPSISANNNPVIASFWIPSLAPQVTKPTTVPDNIPKIMCFSDKPHSLLSAKRLFAVKFNRDPDSKTTRCFSCIKPFNTGSKLKALKPCGHVMCEVCVKSFIVPNLQCNVCDMKVKSRDLITISNEGTGFSSSGTVQVEKYDHAFV